MDMPLSSLAADQATTTPASEFAHWAQLATRWDRRAQIAGGWLADEAAVVDIGCGLMTLRDYLSPGTRYVPVDMVDRGPGTVLVDLNAGALPRFHERTAAMLGVIEYVHDLDAFLPQLRQFKRIVLSYNHVSVQDLAWRLGLREKRVGWGHRLGPVSFARSLERAGLHIVTRHRVRLGEAIYDLRGGTN